MKALKKAWKGAVFTARLLGALAIGFGRTVWDKKWVLLAVGLVAFGLYSLVSYTIQETAELNSIERANKKCQEKAVVKTSHWHGGMQDGHVEQLKEILT